MLSWEQHYEKAEFYLNNAIDPKYMTDYQTQSMMIAHAQVHATLATLRISVNHRRSDAGE